MGHGGLGSKGSEGKGRFLRLTGPSGRRVRRFDGPRARGLWWRPLGAAYSCLTAAGSLRSPPPLVPTAPPSSTGKGSHDSQVAVAPLQHSYHRLTGFSGHFAPLRIQFAGVTRVRLPPRFAVGLWTLCIVPHDIKAKHRANFPLRGGKGTGFVGSRRQPRIQ